MGSVRKEEGKTMRDTVESLKEVVDCTEQEIRAMLSECYMDPNEAVNRLLTQDKFHKVKSKREKKKELKGTVESRSQRARISNPARLVRGCADRVGYKSAQTNSYDSHVTRAKPVQKKEYELITDSSMLGSGVVANNSTNCNVEPMSNNDAIGNIVHAPGLSDHISVASQPSLTPKLNWGVPGKPSMADIVKMGRPQRKIPEEPLPNASTIILSEALQQLQSSENNGTNASTCYNEQSAEVSQRQALEEWILVDCPDKESQARLHVAVDSASHPEPLASYVNLSSDVEGAQSLEEHVDSETENLSSESTLSESEEVDSFPGSFELHEDENANVELSSASTNLLHLSLQKEEQGTEENPAVIIPDHLQVTNADCSHLSFGSFGSGVTSSLPGDSTVPAKSTGFRKPEYHIHELTITNVSASPVSETSSRNFDVVLTPQHDVVTDQTFIAEQAEYKVPSASNFVFSATSRSTNAAFNHAKLSSQMQDFTAFSNLMQPHTDSISSNLLAGNAQVDHSQQSDPSRLRLLTNQCMPTEYNPAMSSLSVPTISISEALRSELLSTLQSNPQPTSSPLIPPHPSFPSYSHPTLPLGQPVPSMLSYPLLHPSLAYMPFSGSSAFHQLPASLQSAGMRYPFPQYKSNMTLNGSVCSDYGGYGSSGVSSNFPTQNPSNIAAGSSLKYEDSFRQYKEARPVPQNNNSSLWGPGSRALPAAAAGTYNGLNGLTQQGSNTRYNSSYMGGMEYPNSYHSQLSRISREQQQSLLQTQGSLNASQGQEASPSHRWGQSWQQSY